MNLTNREAYDEDIRELSKEYKQLQEDYDKLKEEFLFTDGALKELKSEHIGLRDEFLEQQEYYENRLNELKEENSWLKDLCKQITKLSLEVIGG